MNISIEDRNQAKKLFAQGSFYFTKGEYTKARDAYEKAITLNPLQAEYHYRLGNSFEGQRNSTDAIASYTKAIELDPTYMIAYKKLGLLLFDSGDTEQAHGILEKYLSFNPPKRDREMVMNILKSIVTGKNN